MLRRIKRFAQQRPDDFALLMAPVGSVVFFGLIAAIFIAF